MRKMLTKKRKGNAGPISTIAPVVLAVVIAVFISAMGAQMLGGLRETQCAGTIGRYNFTYDVCCTVPYAALNTCNATDSAVGVEFNITTQGMSGIGQFGEWWTIIILAVILGIVVGILFLYLGGTLGGTGPRF